MRECDNPVPDGGGLYCTGDRLRYQSCNTNKCPQQSDFRQEQCEAFNAKVHNITDLPSSVLWEAKYSDLEEGDRCKLYCSVKHSPAYYLLASNVEDGTPCTVDGYDMCVRGQCVQAGCNHILGSSVGLDKCGVCGGDGTSCVLKSGSFNVSSYGYNFVVKIPAGASNIDIRQRGWQGLTRDDNYIAVRDSETGEYLINGGFILSMYKSHFHFGNVMLEYSGSDVVNERLKSSKPLSRDLTVEILSSGIQNNPQVTYSFWMSISRDDVNRSKKKQHSRIFKSRRRRHRKYKQRINKYTWKVGRWSQVIHDTLVTVKCDLQEVDS